MISESRREDIVGALRRGTVPSSGLDALAVGIESFAPTLDEELAAVAAGRGGFKAVRGEYGTGKTFFACWFQGLARSEGFATSEVQISETETPLHRLETVYRRLIEHLSTSTCESGAFRSVVDGWFYTLEEDAIAAEERVVVGNGDVVATEVADGRVIAAGGIGAAGVFCGGVVDHAVGAVDEGHIESLVAHDLARGPALDGGGGHPKPIGAYRTGSGGFTEADKAFRG